MSQKISRLFETVWSKKIATILDGAAGSHVRDFSFDGDSLSFRFSCFVDGSSIFPMSAAPDRKYRYRFSPSLVSYLAGLGFSVGAPLVEDGVFFREALLPCRGGTITASFLADGFTKDVPLTVMELGFSMAFVAEEHEDILRRLERGASGHNAAHELADAEGAALISPREYALLSKTLYIWEDLFRSLAAERTKTRFDFDQHVTSRHGLSREDVLEAIANQVSDQVPEARPKNLANAKNGDVRFAILGVSKGRFVEVILDQSKEGVTVVTAFALTDSEQRLAWWKTRGGGRNTG